MQGGASAKALGQRWLLFQDQTQVDEQREKRSRKCAAFGRRGERWVCSPVPGVGPTLNRMEVAVEASAVPCSLLGGSSLTCPKL